MLIYATPDDLHDWTGQPTPDNAVPLLRKASLLVREATMGAVYSTLDGYPTNPAIRAAMRDATCEHAAVLAAHGIDPSAGLSQLPQQVQSKSADGRSVTYAPDDRRAQIAMLAEGRDLVPDAVQILRDQGLISTRVSAAVTGVAR